MAAYLIDLDGTILEFGGTKLLPGAREFIDELEEQGHQIIFVTRRGEVEWSHHPEYNQEATMNLLQTLGLGKYRVVFDVVSPRVVVNDEGGDVIHKETNEGFPQHLEMARRKKKKKPRPRPYRGPVS